MSTSEGAGAGQPALGRPHPRELLTWLAACPERPIPFWDTRVLQRRRWNAAVTSKREGRITRHERAELQASLEVEFGAWNARREAEHALADYIEAISEEYAGLVARLRSCRMSGVVGRKPDGSFIATWDEKCSLVRLCPDEARTETARVVHAYVPEIRRWISRKPNRRVYFAVFTAANAQPGELAGAKQLLFEQFKDWLRHQYEACPLVLGEHGFEHARRRRLPAFPQISGALVVEEDPLSASGDWNVHLNVLLLADDWVDFGEARDVWGANLHIRPVDPGNLTHAVLELIKYATQTVPTKSAEKRARRASDAPAMTEWPAERWIEWWRAQHGFRRTRSYRCLYALDETRWHDLPLAGPRSSRLDLCRKAGVPTAAFKTAWRRIDQIHGDGSRDKLRAVWKAEDGEKFDINEVLWLGRILYMPGEGYRVDLILENNSRSSNPDSLGNSATKEHSNRDPPLR